MARFADLIRAFDEPVKVLDVGGAAGFWANLGPVLDKPLSLTLLNLTPPSEPLPDGMTAVVGDACDMSEFADGQFDVCFSNSVIEHVGGPDEQRAMADEVRRVGRAYWVQTPNRYFPVESHYHVPLWQFMPVELRARLHQRFDLGWIARERDLSEARRDVESIRLLDAAELLELFPDASLERERIAALTKSLIVHRHAATDRPA